VRKKKVLLVALKTKRKKVASVLVMEKKKKPQNPNHPTII
jgi:hypothetical protein